MQRGGQPGRRWRRPAESSRSATLVGSIPSSCTDDPRCPRSPAELADLLTSDAIGHISFVAPDGSIRSVIVWIDFDGEHVLTSSPLGSYKGRAFRADPRVSVSVVDPRNAGRSLSISGRVTDIRPDEGLAFINKLSQRYRGEPYALTGPREVFTITPDHVRVPRWRGRTREA